MAVIVFGLSPAACSDSVDDPPGGEPFAFSDWVAGIEYVLTIEIADGPRAADSRDFVAWSGTVTTIEWQRQTTTEAGRSVAVAPPSIGDQVDLTISDGVAVSTGATVIALINDVRMSDGVEHLVQLAMNANWQALPGSLQPAVDGLEVAAAASATSDRREAVLAVLTDLTR